MHAVGRLSFDLAMRIIRGGELLATLEIVYVNVDAVTVGSRPLPSHVAVGLRAGTGSPS